MKRKSEVLSIVMLLTGTVLFLAGCRQERIPERQLENTETQTAQVVIGRAERSTLRHLLHLTGTIAAKSQVYVSSKVPGKISEILCKEGDRVSKGDVIIRIDKTEYIAGMRQAKAAVGTAEAGLAKARAGTRPEQIRQLEAATAQARANLDLAEISIKRIENLAKDESIPKAKLDMAVAQEKLARGQHEAAVAGLEMARKGATKEDLAIVESQVAQAKAALASAQVQIDNTEVKSPIEGFVINKMMNVGETIGPGVPILRLVDLSEVKVIVGIPELWFGRISEGMQVEANVDSYSDHPFLGKVTSKIPSVDPRSRTFKIEVAISNMDRDRFLTEGMFCRVELVLVEKQGVVTVPEKAVMESPDGFVVFLVDDGKALRRLVKIGLKEKGLVEIEKGLESGMEVIIEGNFGLKEGVRVNIKAEDKGGRK